MVGALAAGWVVTARLGSGDALAQGGSASDETSTTRVPGADDAWRALLPVGARCRDQDRSAATRRCSAAGVDIEYRTVRARDLGVRYRAAIGAPETRRVERGAPVCARGGEEDRAWSRPDAPRRVTGRYACRIERGRAAMWWTVDDRGLLVHAIASNGDLASLFAWWASHSER